jgi:hypothetical protein
MTNTDLGGVVLSNRYEAFIWTAGPDQIHDPVWFNEFIKVGKGHLVDRGTPNCHIRSINGQFNIGDVVVRDGLGDITPWSPNHFKVVFGSNQFAKLQ